MTWAFLNANEAVLGEMMNDFRLEGLIAATYTPLAEDGSIRLEQVGPLVEHVLAGGVGGLYVCGSTGEGMSLTVEERKSLAREFICRTDGRVPVVVQVGHNSLADAADLARDAQAAGADAISATCPSYYSIGSNDVLIDCMTEIAAAAPELPFYYYHIPALTGVDLPMVEFLPRAAGQINNLVGLKYTKPTIHEFQQCLELEGGRFDIVWGVDEMLLSALSVGANGAIGSTYNIAAPLYQQIWKHFATGDIENAGQLQMKAVTLIDTIAQSPFHPGMKEILRWQGVDCGPPRLPMRRLSSDEATGLGNSLSRIGFDELLGQSFLGNGKSRIAALTSQEDRA